MVKKVSLVSLVFISVYFLMYTVAIFVLERPARSEIAAHRGNSSEFPENTLKAFQSAFEKEVDYIEIDLHQTKDNVVVVIHDDSLDRTTNGSGFVRDYSYEDIRMLDAGRGEKIPTFEEVLALAKRGNRKIIAEIKSPELYPGIEHRVYDLVQKAAFEKKIIIASFDHDRLKQFYLTYPSIPLCAIYDWKTLYIKDLETYEYYCIPAENTLVAPWLLFQIHKNDKKAFVWFQFLENPSIRSLLRFMGADGQIVENL